MQNKKSKKSAILLIIARVKSVFEYWTVDRIGGDVVVSPPIYFFLFFVDKRCRKILFPAPLALCSGFPVPCQFLKAQAFSPFRAKRLNLPLTWGNRAILFLQFGSIVFLLFSINIRISILQSL